MSAEWPSGLFARFRGARTAATTPAESADRRLASVIGAAATDRGWVRPSNQDTVAFVPPADPERDAVLLVVADGMGGHAGGEVASRLAVETITHAVSPAGEEDPGAVLVRAFRSANTAIYREGARTPQHTGMGTTCTAVLIRQGFAYCAHVGDSRLYLIRDGVALQMTNDHNAVFERVKRGTLDRETARRHPDRHLLTRSLGTRPEVRIDSWPQPLFVRFDDHFVVSSDGLHELISDGELTDLVTSQEPALACRSLIDLALARGGPDNISAGILRISR